MSKSNIPGFVVNEDEIDEEEGDGEEVDDVSSRQPHINLICLEIGQKLRRRWLVGRRFGPCQREHRSSRRRSCRNQWRWRRPREDQKRPLFRKSNVHPYPQSMLQGGDDEDFPQRRPKAQSRSASVSSRESYEDGMSLPVWHHPPFRWPFHCSWQRGVDTKEPSTASSEKSSVSPSYTLSFVLFSELREAQDLFGFEDDEVLGNMDG